MNCTLKSAIGLIALAGATSAFAEITLYQGEGYRGRAVTTAGRIPNLERSPMGDRAGSVVVGSGNWQVCESPGYAGRCVFLTEGSYDSLWAIGLSRASSVRAVTRLTSHEAPVPPPYRAPNYRYRQLPHERIYDAPVTHVRAMFGPPERRCWLEREQVVERGSEGPSGKGALIGGLIGGILGHQIGDGNDAATVGGALAGAAIGSTAGRDTDRVYNQDVQRCEDYESGEPEFWDVTYVFQGIEHHVQMSQPPGRTIMVNSHGEPRG
jgi:uncharacterized protein YcfJ